ncbi:MAG: hypothetical protein ACLU98_07115 [Desulfovibrio fairfieldensis]
MSACIAPCALDIFLVVCGVVISCAGLLLERYLSRAGRKKE